MADEPSSGSGTDLAGIGAWSKVGQSLIDIFARRWVEPSTIRAIAQAKADAYKIEETAKTEVDIHNQALLQRAARRMANDAISEQANIEGVLKKALPDLNDSAKPDSLDLDWTTSFIKHAGAISNEEMQGLWAKILAGETNKHGSFGKRTLNLVSELSQSEAALFSTICRYQALEGPMIFNYDDDVYKRNNISFGSIMALKSTGLIDTIDLGDFCRTKVAEFFVVPYFKKLIFITKASGDFITGKVAFTPAGVELSVICKVEPIEGFYDYLLKKWYPLGASEAVIDPDGIIRQQRMINADGKDELSPFPTDMFNKYFGHVAAEPASSQPVQEGPHQHAPVT